MTLLSRRNHQDPPSPARPVRILQIGGGVFLRGFLDWMVDVANQAGAFDGSVAVALSTDASFAEAIRRQDMLYTVLVRGLRDGREVMERRIVEAISDAFGLADDWARAVAVACEPSLVAIVSNTTEAGISDVAEPSPGPGLPPRSFPARLTALLHARWRALKDGPGSGVLVLPCELIEDNGPALKRIVLAHAARWTLEPGFRRWVETEVDVLSTLVDRIVPGFPKTEAATLFEAWGYEDRLAVAAEPFHLWAIEGGPAHRARLPLDAAGLNVVWTENLRPWRESKVRVLNGGHIATALAAFLAGHDTVGEMIGDERFARFLQTLIDRDILPFLPLAPEQGRAYADAVLERFANPFVRHELLSISVGSIGKWAIRILPSLHAVIGRDGRASPRIAFSLASLIRFVRGEREGARRLGVRGASGSYAIRDDDAGLDRINDAWRRHAADPDALARAVLSDATLWGEDLTRLADFAELVARSLALIESEGIGRALDDLNEGIARADETPSTG